MTREEVRSLPEVEYRPAGWGDGLSVPPMATELGRLDGEGSEDEGEATEGSEEIEMSGQAATARALLAERPEGDDENGGNHGVDGMNPLSSAGHWDDNTCTICIEEYQEGEKLRVLPCRHAFHSDCIMPWLTQRSPTCPLCKAEFEATGGEEEREGAEDEGGDAVLEVLGLNLELQGDEHTAAPLEREETRTITFAADESDASSDDDDENVRTLEEEENPVNTRFWRFMLPHRLHRGGSSLGATGRENALLSDRIGEVLNTVAVQDATEEDGETSTNLREPLLEVEGEELEEAEDQPSTSV